MEVRNIDLDLAFRNLKDFSSSLSQAHRAPAGDFFFFFAPKEGGLRLG